MRVERIYNNNVVLAKDRKKNEIVLIGKGIAFGLSRGDYVNKDLIEKQFEFKGETGFKFKEIIADIPLDVISLSDELIDYIKQESKIKLSDRIYVTLTDHIANLVERVNKGITFDTNLLWNVKYFYPNEYKIGLVCVEKINEQFHMKIEQDEASFFAMHIINAAISTDMPEVYRITGLLDKIVEIVKNHFGEIDMESYDFERFILHCRFFARNMVLDTSNQTNSEFNTEIYEMLGRNYENQVACIDDINECLKTEYDYVNSIDESLYLLVHLMKLTT